MGLFEFKKKLLEKQLKEAERKAEISLAKARKEAEILRRQQEVKRKQIEAKRIKEAELEKLRKQISELKGRSVTPAQREAIERRKKMLMSAGKSLGTGLVTTLKALDRATDSFLVEQKKPPRQRRTKKKVVRRKPVKKTNRKKR